MTSNAINQEPVDFGAAIEDHQLLPIYANEVTPGATDQLFQDYASLLKRLDTSSWQIIYGAPGSGKTAAMRTFAERSNRGSLSHRPITSRLSTLAVYLDAAKFQPPPRPSEAEQANAAFRRFLDRLGSEVISLARGLEGDKLYSRARRPYGDDARAIVREILSVVDQAKPLWPQPGGSVKIDASSKTDVASTDARGMGMSAGLGSGTTIKATIRGRFSRDRRTATRSSHAVASSVEGVGEPEWDLIADLLKGLLEALQMQRVDILIDNWTAIDADGSRLIQPHFAELLKLTLRGHPEISVKIAADGLQARLWDPEKRRGLRLGTDIEKAENLNFALLSDSELMTFFEQLLFRRLHKVAPRCEQFIDQDSPGAPISEDFLLGLFRDRDAFELLVKGTEGRPRLFLQCFRDLAHACRFSVSQPWDTTTVLRAVQGRSLPELDDDFYYSPAVKLLLTDIRSQVVRSNHSRFVWSDAEYARREQDVQELIAKDLVMRDNSREARELERQSKRSLRVTTSVMAEWERARHFQQYLEHAEEAAWPERGATDA